MKTLTYKEGNLLLADDVQVIGHQANCQNTFGSGIARSIREMYPDAYTVDTMCAMKKSNTLGRFSLAHIPDEQRNKHGTNIRFIYNLYGQNLGTNHARYDRKTNYEALFCALEGMAEHLRAEPNIYSIGFPHFMGSALGGGSWEIVSRLIEVAFDGYEGNVIIYKLNTK